MTDAYSADTDDLDAFAEHSSGNVAAFGATADGLEAGRGRLALLPLPSFVQSSTLDRYRDLIGFMAENGRFAAEVSDALKQHGSETSPGVYRADAARIGQALAASDGERLDDLERGLIDQGVDPETAAAVAAEVAAALRADPTLSFAEATRAGFAAHQGISLDEAARAERAFSLSPPEVATIVDEHFDELAGRSGNDDQITIEDLQDAIADESLDPQARDAAYRLAADGILFTNLDVAHQTDLSDEPLGNGFAWHEADGIIGRDDVTEFPAKDHRARILLAWHPLVETAGQGYDLARVDSHATADDVTTFIEDEDIPAYVRLAVFDVYAERHDLTLTEREVLEQELAFDGRDARRRNPARRRSWRRTAPSHTGGPGSDRPRWSHRWKRRRECGRRHLRPAVGDVGRVRMEPGPSGQDRPRRRAGHHPHQPPSTGAEVVVDPTELAHLSPAEAKAHVAHFAAHGTPHRQLGPTGSNPMPTSIPSVSGACPTPTNRYGSSRHPASSTMDRAVCGTPTTRNWSMVNLNQKSNPNWPPTGPEPATAGTVTATSRGRRSRRIPTNGPTRHRG